MLVLTVILLYAKLSQKSIEKAKFNYFRDFKQKRKLFFMENEYVSSEVSEKIKRRLKEFGITAEEMLSELGMGKRTLQNYKASMPKADNLAKIADYLDCSVDYLLGRTDSPTVSGNYINGDNNVQAIRTGNGDMTIHAEKQLSKGIDPTTEEFIKIFCDLDFDDKFEVMQLLMQKRGEKK